MRKKDMDTSKLSRRAFLMGSVVAGASVATAMTGCSPQKSEDASDTAAVEGGGDASTEAFGGLPVMNDVEFPLMPIEGTSAFVSEKINEADVVQTIECDVVVCGAGMSGLAAAASLAENGLKVVVLEKGGSFSFRGATIGAINDSAHKKVGAEFDQEAILEDALLTMGYRCNRDLWADWVYRSGEAIDWMMGFGQQIVGGLIVAGKDETFGGITSWGTMLAPVNGVESIVQALCDKAIELGVDIRYKTPACQLVEEDGTVGGVIVESSEGYVRINGKVGTVLATGGYENNWERMKKCVKPRDIAVNLWRSPTQTATGDGHDMALAIGALEDDYPHVMMLDPCVPVDHPDFLRALMLPLLRVNKEGKRFVNEGISLEFLADAIKQLPKGEDYVVLAGDIQKLLGEIALGRGNTTWSAEEMYEALKPSLIEAETIEELAEKIGVDPRGLAETAARNEDLVALGKDVDFFRPDYSLYSLEEGPYYAVKEGSCALVTVSGVRVNSDYQVLNDRGSAIEKLYAIGNVAGSMFYGTYPHHLNAISHGRCVTFGYLLGRRLAGVE